MIMLPHVINRASHFLRPIPETALVSKSLYCVEDEQHFDFDLPSVQPYQVTTFQPPAALLYYCRLYNFV